jgi:trans-aconitate 2-methyltransferase
VGDPWDPASYERFAAERNAPFFDLLALVRPIPGGRAADLGCGTGALTAELRRRVQGAETLGVDSSAAMLARAAAVAGGDGTWSSPTPRCSGCRITRGCWSGWPAPWR